MNIRDDHIIDDLQQVFVKLLRGRQTVAPWTRWEVIYNFPMGDVLEELDKPVIHVGPPMIVGQGVGSVGGGLRGASRWEIKIGFWDDRKTGSEQELNVMASTVLDFFKKSNVSAVATFDLSLSGTTVSATTLAGEGVRVQNIQGPRIIRAVTDIKEFRCELIVTFLK